MTSATSLAELLNLRLAFSRFKFDTTSRRVFVQHPFEIRLAEVDLNAWLTELDTAIRIRNYYPNPMYVCDVPKPNGGVRPGAWLSMRDAVVYTALVSACAEKILGTISSTQRRVDYGYLISSRAAAPQWTRRPFSNWKDFTQDSIKAATSDIAKVVVTDISGFYDNIDIGVLVSDLNAIGFPTPIIEQISTCLNKWALVTGRGIPQGYTASDILAKLYLHSVNENFLAEGFAHKHYVDDIRIFTRSHTEARTAILRLAVLLRQRGLSLQSAKTKILDTQRALEYMSGVQPKIDEIRKKFGDEVVELIGNPYISSFEIENRLHLSAEDAPVDVYREAFVQFFDSQNQSDFDKTLLRFLIKRLGKAKDHTAKTRCIALLRSHPEETDAYLDYFEQLGLHPDLERAIAEFLESEECIYQYQKYLIVLWLSTIDVSFSTELISCVRRIELRNTNSPLLRFSCRAFLSRHGNHSDWERLINAYRSSEGELEKAEIVCSIARMEAGRRNAFYARVEHESELVRRAVRLAKTMHISDAQQEVSTRWQT